VLDHHQEALGTSTPTSITVVDTSTGISAAGQTVHHRLLLGRRHARMQQADQHAGQRGGAQFGVGGGGVAQVQRLALLDQRADPVHLPALRQLGADALDHLVAPRRGHQPVTTGVRPGGSSSMVETSRSA
jgi:hypothetical protein